MNAVPAKDSDLTKTLREWDRGSKQTRLRILQNFVARNKNKTGPQLEKEYGNGASLLLARISTWLRLTYLIGSAISLQLQAVSVFITASSGQRFLSEFLEVGGVNTLLEVLGLERIGEEDRQQAFSVLQHIANSGRYYKELICENEGVKVVAECLGRTRDEATLDAGRNLLTNLGRGNPRHSGRVQAGVVGLLQSHNSGAQRMAAQALRVLLQANPPRPKGSASPPPAGVLQPDSATVAAAVLMLRSFNFQVQYEAYELLKVLGSYPELAAAVLDALVAALRPNLADFDAAAHFAEQAAVAAAEGGELQRGQRLYHPLHTQQACAAKMLGILAGLSRKWATRMTRRNVLPGLLSCLSNLDHFESQKQGGQTLFGLCSLLPRAAEITKKLLGPDLYDTFMKHPDTLYRDMSAELVQVLHKAAREGDLLASSSGDADASSGSEGEGSAPQPQAGSSGAAAAAAAGEAGASARASIAAQIGVEDKGRPLRGSVAARTSVAARVDAPSPTGSSGAGQGGSKRSSVANPKAAPVKKSEAEQLGMWAPMVMEDAAGNTLAASMVNRTEAARVVAEQEGAPEHDNLRQKIEKLAAEPIVERRMFPVQGDEPEFAEPPPADEEGEGGVPALAPAPDRSRQASRGSIPTLQVAAS